MTRTEKRIEISRERERERERSMERFFVPAELYRRYFFVGVAKRSSDARTLL